jgi:hypothetical protein
MTIERSEPDNLPAQRKTPVALSRPLTDIDQAWRMAQALAPSSLLPDDLRNKTADVLTMILYGQDLGFSPMQSIQGIYVVKGKPQLSAQTWIALTRKAGHRLSVLEHTAETCTVEIIRGDTGERHAETSTIADAETARLTGKDSMYSKYPKRMLLARAVTNCCRFICPEIALGFGTEGEYEEPAASPEQALAHAVDARTERPAEPDDVPDAEVVEEPQQSDEEVRQDLLDLAAQHQGANGEQSDVWPEPAEPGSWGGDH